MQDVIYTIDNHKRDVESCTYDSAKRVYKVKFAKSDTYYYYKKDRLTIYNKEKTHTAPYVTVRYKDSGEYMSGVNKVTVYASYEYFNMKQSWVINDVSFYTDDKVQVETSCITEASRNAYEYLKALSKYGLRTEDGDELLANQYNKIQSIALNSLLEHYLLAYKPYNPSKIPVVDTPIFPFGCNQSQYTAVVNALSNQMSIIQGPPGTGKTQTILNIIANLLIAGKTIQVVSNNNSAVENVVEKLAKPRYAMDFMVAMLGRSENQTKFIENQTGKYPNLLSWYISAEELENLRMKIAHCSALLPKIYSKQERLAAVENELLQLDTEQKHFEEFLASINFSAHTIQIKYLSSQQILQAIQKMECNLEKKGRLSLLQRIYILILRWLGFDKRDDDIINTLKQQYYIYRHEELLKEKYEIQDFLDANKDTLADFEQSSLKYLKGVLFERYNNGSAERQVFEASELKRYSRKFLEEYPIVLSTTFSSLSNIDPEVKFDYLIMDEASQVDITTGALAMYSAQNMVVVGDLKQLPNVITDDMRRLTDSLYERYDLPQGFQYSDNSFLKSIIQLLPKVPSVLLREHYRCHPLIIGFCNKKFYGGDLVVMTKSDDNTKAINLVRTVAGNHSRGKENIRQVDAVLQDILPTLSAQPDEIGIIAPYNTQVNALHHALQNANHEDIVAATVHKFQGKEKDVIVLSTVDNQIGDFVDDPNLLNVAISRAKKEFYLLVSGEETTKGNINDLVSYIQYYQGNMIESNVRSVFDLLYSAYTKERIAYIQSHRRVSQYDSENVFYGLLRDILDRYELHHLSVACHCPLQILLSNKNLLTEEEQKYAFHPRTHVDFLLYDKASLQPLYVMEVDGCSFHKRGEKQYERDLMKDGILRKYGIPLHRFKTNESNEEKIIISDLEKLEIIKQ